LVTESFTFIAGTVNLPALNTISKTLNANKKQPRIPLELN